MARKKVEDVKKDTNAWITTYTDLCTLLLTFFVLLLSMSHIEQTRTRKALDSLVGAFGLLPGGRSPFGKTKGTDIRGPTSPIVPSEPIELEMLKQVTVSSDLYPEVVVLRQKEKLVIRINQRALFVSGSMELSAKARGFLTTLAGYLRDGEGEIEINGHTDRFEELEESGWSEKSWLLSAQRAQAVETLLLGQGIAFNRLTAHGFSYYQPIIDSLAFPELRFKNQRVEILLGSDAQIPRKSLWDKPEARPYIRYKDFFFKITPQPQGPEKKTD